MSALEKLVAPDAQKAKAKQQASTSKKLKAIAHEQMMNMETGEIFDVGHVVIEERDAHFEKIWLGHVLEAIDEIGTKKIQVLSYLFKNRNRENMVVRTNKQIADDLQLSYGTVASTLATLTKHDIITRGTGFIQINPNVIFKGKFKHRMDVLMTYKSNKANDDEAQKPNQAAQLAGLLSQLTKLLAQIQKLGVDGADTSAVTDLVTQMLSQSQAQNRA